MAVRLSSRCVDILSLLVASDEPLAAAEMGSQLNISARMVRSSLGPAAAWLENNNISLMQVRGRGVCLVGPETSKRNLAEAIRAYDKPVLWLSPSERVNIVLLTLFFSNQPTQLKQLQEALNLSRTTTFRVLDASDKWLRAHRLELIRRPNYGCNISGDELNWREGVIELIQESAGDARLLARLQGLKTIVNLPARPRAGLDETLSTIWSKLDIPWIKQLMSPIEEQFAGTLSDRAYIEVFIYLAVSVYRLRMGKQLSTPPDSAKYPLLASRVSEARQIATTLYQRLGIQLPAAELDWLALKIAEASPVLFPSGTWHSQSERWVDSNVRRIVEQIVGQASLSLHPGLSTDQELIQYLGIEIARMLDRQQAPRGQALRGPLLREVATQFPYVYSVAQQSSHLLTEQLGIELHECEIGNIAACLVAAMERLRRSDQPKKRVLVVCSEGAVTAWLLVSRLRAEFPDVEVAEVISALELENRKILDGIDVIVSTIPLNVKNIPNRQVNPLLGVDDCRKLKELLQQKWSTPSTNPLPRNGKVHLADLVTPHMIDLGVDASDWREVVWKAGSRLLQAGLIESQFIRAMEEIILKYGPYMVIWPGAVLLHAPTDGVRHLGMEILTLRKPVCFDHAENDPVQLAVVLAASDNHSHFTALQELNQLMQNPEARSAIGSTLHKSVVLHWISQYSNGTEM